MGEGGERVKSEERLLTLRFSLFNINGAVAIVKLQVSLLQRQLRHPVAKA